MKISQIAPLVLLIGVSSTVLAKEVVLDEKAVNVPLPVGKEIIIKFPKAVTHTEALDKVKIAKLQQFLRPDGVLMLEAGEPFGKARLIASMVDGNVVVLDLDAAVGAVNDQTITLVDPRTLKKPTVQTTANKVVQTPPKNQQTDVATPEENPNKPDFLKDNVAKTQNASAAQGGDSIGFNQMVQFGFRHFAGPPRLIGTMKAKKVNVGTSGLKYFVRVWGNRLSIKPLQQWKIDGNYLTVMLVNNHSPHPLAFDPRALRGRIVFAATLYPTIQPQGSPQDQTLWAVITEIPFNKAIKIK